jgi:hypothetical protein
MCSAVDLSDQLICPGDIYQVRDRTCLPVTRILYISLAPRQVWIKVFDGSDSTLLSNTDQRCCWTMAIFAVGLPKVAVTNRTSSFHSIGEMFHMSKRHSFPCSVFPFPHGIFSRLSICCPHLESDIS